MDFTSRAAAFTPHSTLPTTDATLSLVRFFAAVEVALAGFAAVVLVDEDRLGEVFEADLADAFAAVALVDDDRLEEAFEAVLAGDLVIDLSPFSRVKRTTARFGSGGTPPSLRIRPGSSRSGHASYPMGVIGCGLSLAGGTPAPMGSS
jgi:hypothetical protein